MLDRRGFNTLLAGAAGWVTLGARPRAAQPQTRVAVYASVDARLYRIRRDGDVRLNTDGSIGDEVDQDAGLDVGFYAHAVHVMPTNRSVLLITRGNEPVRGISTEDPGALYVYDFENGQLDKQAVRGAKRRRGLPRSTRRLSSLWTLGLRRSGNSKPASYLRHSCGRHTVGRAALCQHDARLAVDVKRRPDNIFDSYASDERPNLVRCEPRTRHGNISGRESGKWHRKHSRGLLGRSANWRTDTRPDRRHPEHCRQDNGATAWRTNADRGEHGTWIYSQSRSLGNSASRSDAVRYRRRLAPHVQVQARCGHSRRNDVLVWGRPVLNVESLARPRGTRGLAARAPRRRVPSAGHCGR